MGTGLPAVTRSKKDEHGGTGKYGRNIRMAEDTGY